MSVWEGLLRQALGSQALLCGYPLPASRRGLAIDELEAQAFSTDALCVAEDLPLLCGHLAASSLALDLLADAGWGLPERLLVFRDHEELLARILSEASKGGRVAASFPLPEGRIPPEAHLIAPELRAMLNDKGNLERLVPEGQHPVRRRVEVAELLQDPARCRGAVLKIATGESGGGRGVLLPPDSEDPVLVRALLQRADSVILEEFLPFTNTRCFNYLIDGTGEVRFLGAPEQLLLGARYLGNWFEADDSPEPGAVAAGVEICKRAANLGYHGAAGFDAGFLQDGSFRFVDLNFRMNGSTAPLLLAPELLRRSGAPAALRTGLRGKASPKGLASNLRRLIAEKRFFTLAVVLSEAEASDSEFLVSGFLMGSDRDDILASAADVTWRLLGR